MALTIKKINQQDQPVVQEIITRLWGDPSIVAHGNVYQTADLEGIKATLKGDIVGVLHYQIKDRECEILSLASLQENQGVGSALLAAVEDIARSHNCLKLTLITTNDNLRALGFYQRRGFRLTALFPGQVEVSRGIKPSIPIIGENNIPLQDELQLEKTIF